MTEETQSFQDFFSSISADVIDLDRVIEFEQASEDKNITLLLDSDQQVKWHSITTKCNNYLLTKFEKVNFQILEGNYIRENIDSEIEELKALINELNSSVIALIISFAKDNEIQNFKSDLDKIVSALNFLKKLIKNFFYKENGVTFSISTSSSGNFENVIESNDWCLSSARILCYNIYLVNIDHYLKIERQDLIQNLEIIYTNSKNLYLSKDFSSKYSKIANLVYLKSNFLRKKVLLRKAEGILACDDDNESNDRLFIQSRNEFEEFSIDKIINTPSLTYFKTWLEYLVNHYQLDKSFAISIETLAVKIPLLDINGLQFKDIHLLIKYNKDVLSKSFLDISINNLEEIKNSLISRLKQSKQNSLEEFQLIVNSTYCFNNLLSLLEKNNKFTELEKTYAELKNIERLKNRKNYFATGIMLCYYEKKLKSIFESEQFTENLSVCDDAIIESKELLKIFQDESAWFKNHNNYVYILSAEESTISIDLSKLYVFSSFILPLSEAYLENKFKATVENINLYITSFNSISSLQSTFEELKSLRNDFNSTSKKIDEKESRTIEIVSLTTAILAFISGSVSGFKFIETGTEAIYFTLALGTSLGFFVLLLYILNRKLISNKNLVKGSLAAAVIVILGWVFLFYTRHQNLNYNKKPDESNNTFKIENKLQHNQHNSTFQNKDSIAPER